MVLRGVTPSLGVTRTTTAITTTTITAKGMVCTAARRGRDHRRLRTEGHFEEAGSRTKKEMSGMVWFSSSTSHTSTRNLNELEFGRPHVTKGFFNGYVNAEMSERERLENAGKGQRPQKLVEDSHTNTDRTTAAAATSLSLSTKDTLVLADTKHLHRHTDTLMYHFSCNSPLQILP